MRENPQKPTSPYLNSPPRTLYDACHALGRDDDGEACPSCPVRCPCVTELIRCERYVDHPLTNPSARLV